MDLTAALRHWRTGHLTQMLGNARGIDLLNYGSGDGGDRKWLESRGYHVTTFDIYPGTYTGYVCNTAVFEHLYNPFQAACEIHRVLRVGATVIGSAAFLEPFHANSYFHMSHLGLKEVLQRAGFRQIDIQPGWSFLEALNGSFWIWNQVSVVKKVSSFINRTKFRWGRKLWEMGYRMKGKPIPESVTLGFCGSLVFRAEK